MKIKQFLFVVLEVIVVFVVVMLSVEQTRISQDVNHVRNIGFHYEWFGFLNNDFWQVGTLLILSLGTSMLFWKRQGVGQKNARDLFIYSGIFSLFSLLIIVAAIRINSQLFLLPGLLIFFVTSLLVSTSIHYVTLQAKYKLLESLKIIFLGFVASWIILFSGLLAARPYNRGDTGAGLFFVAVFLSLVVIGFLSSLIINFTLLKTFIRRVI